MNINAVFDLLNNQETLDEGFRLLLELHKKYLYAVFWDKLSEHNITKKNYSDLILKDLFQDCK